MITISVDKPEMLTSSHVLLSVFSLGSLLRCGLAQVFEALAPSQLECSPRGVSWPLAYTLL